MEISQILKCRCCGDMFPNDMTAAQSVYFDLMLRFHPDRCSDPDAVRAAAVINGLYGKLKRSRTYQKKRLHKGGGEYEISYLMEIVQEYGSEYIGDKKIYLLLDKEPAECFTESKAKSERFFKEGVPRQILSEAEMFLPEVSRICDTDEGLLIEINKPEGELPLAKVPDVFGGKLDSRHTAWIISRLLGICCYAEVRGIVWNCLCEENLLIDPEIHTVRVAGGWWFAAEAGSKMTGVQSSIYDSLSAPSKSDGIARHINDLECVKSLARRMLGDDAPQAVKDYAESLCSSSAFEEMEKWENTIIKGYGARRFTPLNVRLPDIC